ncbi:hypothetical protein J6590_062539 [Homalodisca vitripennis]|nr:hypothetical protein J6590_062539 [Homalodisca vitripennis]
MIIFRSQKLLEGSWSPGGLRVRRVDKSERVRQDIRFDNQLRQVSPLDKEDKTSEIANDLFPSALFPGALTIKLLTYTPGRARLLTALMCQEH